MAIKGSLKEASLPDVLQLLRMGKKTGCLAVADRQQLRLHLLRRGPHLLRVDRQSARPARRHAGQDGPDHARRSSTRRCRCRHRGATSRIGELLVAHGRRHAGGSCDEYIRLQIEEAVYFLFTWTHGTFNFEAGGPARGAGLPREINPESLLLEGARRVDEWSLIEKKIPSFDLIFAVTQEASHSRK